MHKKIAIVEIGGSHDECLLSQFHALKSESYNITFVTTQKMRDRNPYFEQYVDQWYIVETNGQSISDFRKIKQLSRYLIENSIFKVVLNTAQGGHIRNLVLISPKKIEFIGIVHTLKKFQDSFTQRIIDLKVKKYFLLNDFLVDQVKKPKLKIESFYPLRFPGNRVTLSEKKPGINICLLGEVDNRRKDMNGFFKILNLTLNEDVHFTFLGKTPSEFESKFLEFPSKIKYSNSFVNKDLAQQQLAEADFIIPLIHKDSQSAMEYFTNQISGSINVAFAFKIPMLIDRAFQNWPDFQKSAFFYDLNTFVTDFKSACENRESKHLEMTKQEKFYPEFQENKYIKFIES